MSDVAADLRRAEEPAATATDEDEAKELATSNGTSQRSLDVNDCLPEEASQGEANYLLATDGNSDPGKSKLDIDTLAKGIASVFGPVMSNFDGGVEGVLKSQSILASSIDRLTRELDKLLEDVPHPYATHHATRLSGIRKRVIALNTNLRIIQKRMEMIQRLLAGYASRASTSVHMEKASVKGSHSTSHDVPLMEVPPSDVSSQSADSHSRDELMKVEGSKISNLSENLCLGGLHDIRVQEKQDVKGDLLVSANKDYNDQVPGDATVARDEAGGSNTGGN